MIRLLIGDSHLLFRQGIKCLLSDEADLDVVAEAANAAEVLDTLRNASIDVAILDLVMPDCSGAALIKQIKARYPFLAILILTAHAEKSLVLSTLNAGANGYMTKENDVDELVSVIHKLAHGGKYVSQAIGESLVFGLFSHGNNTPPHLRLSDREFKIFELLSAGKRGAEIASELSLSEKTISAYKTNLFRKMNFRNHSELVLYAIHHGLFTT